MTPRPAIIDNGEKAYQARSELSGHLGDRALRALAAKPGQPLVVDLSRERKELKAGLLLAVSLALANRWKKELPEKRIGVVFPAGLGGIITNLALMLAGKVPVNLNFTASRSALLSSLAKAGVRTIITAGPVMEKLPDFPWPDHIIDLMQVRDQLRKLTILRWLLCTRLLPPGLLSRLAGVPRVGNNREAAILFSSGSAGEPKGVVLTHRNILANCAQIDDCGLLDRREIMMANLPTFHSFGFTVTLWYPLLTGMRIVTLPSPLETKRVAQAIAAENVTVMMGTPTFFRPYFKRIDPALLKSLKVVVGGAEKTPPGFAERWQDEFGCVYLEGYGLTETSPVVSANLPERLPGGKTNKLPAAIRAGSVGCLFPGMAARITDPGSGQPRTFGEVGMVELRGPNVFNGYLEDPGQTEAVFRDGWFITGDLGRLDEDGYLYIDGRLSRFSKIGGEMVPHGTLEQTIVKAFNLEDAEIPLIAITGITDLVKGEALVLLAAIDLSLSRVREKLTELGVPNLWIPKTLRRVEKIPTLASGKLDLRAMEELAREKSSEQVE